jgi:DNA replication and repair protein RecF
MIRFGADAGRIALRGTTGSTAFETDVRLTSRDARRASLNGERLASADRLRQDLRTLVFTPDRLAVVKGAPSTRRAYLDRSLGRLLPSRATLPAEYAAAVGQRNAGLRRLRGGASSPCLL